MSAKRAQHGSGKQAADSPSQIAEDDEAASVPGPFGNAPSLEEWYAVRKAAFAELRKYEIPQNLVDAVHDFRPHAAVTWLNDKGEPADSDDVLVVPMVAEPERKPPETTSQFPSGAREKFDELSQWTLPKAAGDALAVYLLSQLRRTRAETAAVRAKKLLAPSIIARVAIDILSTYALFGRPPGDELVELFSALLGVDKRPLEGDRQFEAREKAAWILAQVPDMSTRGLARFLKVDASTVSRWRRDQSFVAQIESKKIRSKICKDKAFGPTQKPMTCFVGYAMFAIKFLMRCEIQAVR